MRLPLPLLLVALLFAVFTASVPAVERLAPLLRFVSENGTETALAASRGRVVLMDIWASWCAPCRTSFPILDQLYRDYRSRGLDVFAVNVDEHKKDARRFLEGRAYEMPVFFDPAGATPAAMKVAAMPTSFLIDRKGIVRFSHEGYSEQTLREYRSEIDQLLRETP